MTETVHSRLTLYLLLGDVPAPLRQQIISTNASEAWYVIDGLCNHETDFNIEEHSTDTGGSSEHVFGMCHFAESLDTILLLHGRLLL